MQVSSEVLRMFKAVATFTSAYVEDRILLVGGRDISSNLLVELLGVYP